MPHDVYRDGKVFVMADRCSTCIFRPGNLMSLKPGRVKGMVEDAIAGGSVIVCHQTLEHTDIPNATCRGFYDSYRDNVQALQLAERLNMIEEQPLPEKESQDGQAVRTGCTPPAPLAREELVRREEVLEADAGSEAEAQEEGVIDLSFPGERKHCGKVERHPAHEWQQWGHNFLVGSIVATFECTGYSL